MKLQPHGQTPGAEPEQPSDSLYSVFLRSPTGHRQSRQLDSQCCIGVLSVMFRTPTSSVAWLAPPWHTSTINILVCLLVFAVWTLFTVYFNWSTLRPKVIPFSGNTDSDYVYRETLAHSPPYVSKDVSKMPDKMNGKDPGRDRQNWSQVSLNHIQWEGYLLLQYSIGFQFKLEKDSAVGVWSDSVLLSAILFLGFEWCNSIR